MEDTITEKEHLLTNMSESEFYCTVFYIKMDSHGSHFMKPQQDPKRKCVSGKNELSHQGIHPSTKYQASI